MANWNDILKELQSGSNFDLIRRRYVRQLAELTGRNVICYYSGWLEKPNIPHITSLNDADKNGFMNAIHGLDRSKGLDLMLHTPGGDVAATESLVDYLRSMFGKDIRAIVPQLAMSGGTMIACSCKSILMGKHSSLGPVDPQFGGIPAHGVVEEFKRAMDAAQNAPHTIPIWQVLISKYHPSLIGECEKAILWADDMVREWLMTGMLEGDSNAAVKAAEIAKELGDHALTKSHARHLSFQRCRQMGLVVEALEDNQELQNAVLSVHHAFVHTLSASGACKIIENQNGRAYIQMQQKVLITDPMADM